MKKPMEEEVVEMYVNNMPVVDICAELGLHPPSVYQVLRKYDISLRGRTPKPQESTPQLDSLPSVAKKEFRVRLAKDYEAGASITDLAAKNMVTYGRVRNDLLKEGVVLRSKKGQWALLRKAVLRMNEEGGDLNGFMREYDIPAQIVYDWIRRATGPKTRIVVDEGAIVRRAVEQAKRELQDEKTDIEQMFLPGAERWE